MKAIAHISPEKIYWSTAIITTICIFAAVFLWSPLPLILPVVLMALMALVGKFRWMYWLLMVLLIVSIDLELPGGFGLDFPSEPLMLALTACTIAFFLTNPKKVNHHFFNHPLFQVLCLHLFWIGVTAIFSEYPMASFKMWLSKVWYIFPFTILGGWFVRSHEDFRPIFWGLIVSLSLVVVYALFNYKSYNFDFEFVNKTMTPFYLNHVDYGVILALILPFSLFLRSWYTGGSIARLVIDCCSVLMLIGIVFSYTRAAYISVAVIPIAWAIFKFRLSRVGIITGVLVAIVGLSYLAHDNKYIDYAPNYDKTIYHANFEDHLNATINMSDLSTMERVHRWVAGMTMWQDHPFLGFGPSTFNKVYKPYTSRLFATYVSDNEEESTVHNYYLLTLIEQGVPGLLIFLSLCFMLLIYGEDSLHRLKEKRNRDLLMAVLISLFLFLINNLMADLVEIDEIGTFFFFYIAIIINFNLLTKGKGWEATDFE